MGLGARNDGDDELEVAVRIGNVELWGLISAISLHGGGFLKEGGWWDMVWQGSYPWSNMIDEMLEEAGLLQVLEGKRAAASRT